MSSLKSVVVVSVAVVVLLLFAVGWPASMHVRRQFRRGTCLDNIRQISGAKEAWAMATNQRADAPVDWADLDAYIKEGTNGMVCPCDPDQSCTSSYDLQPLGELPRCKVMPAEHAFPKSARVLGMQIIFDEDGR